jgi:hypothetical protein
MLKYSIVFLNRHMDNKYLIDLLLVFFAAISAFYARRAAQATSLRVLLGDLREKYVKGCLSLKPYFI